jgi:serine/threonine protein kinase
MAPTNFSESPRRLGDFEILRELGRGGMGVVYEARQVSLNRKVALKVLAGSLGLTAKAVERFHREAEAAAKLHHTNIVPVYATGEENGTHFYAMELIDGPSLDLVIKQLRRASQQPASGDSTSRQGTDSPNSPHLAATGPYVGDSSPLQVPTSSALSSDSQYFDNVARMIADVADALDHAHKNGVIHRDVKPSNLLLSSAGRLSMNDFGLARVLEQPGMTMTGEFVGTPAYMSPEQVTAGRIPLDHRTDIYSLGATLYECLTLEPPYRGKSRDELLAQIVHKEPRSPRRIHRRVPVDLETICLKCLEKDPDRRYQSAGELREDLRRYVNRFAITARRAGPLRRAVKWVKRKPAVAASLSCVVLAIGAALGFAYQAYRADVRRAEEQERARAQLLDEKVRSAYMVAFGGDLRMTEEEIKEIETLGGSSGQVRLLRGMVHYFRGDIANAIDELEQAVKLLPENVAAHALLGRSYTSDGQFDRAGELFQVLEQLSPSSPEDYIFKGFAQASEGLVNLDEGIRRRNSPLGRALRAQAWTDRAHDTGKQLDAEKALADAEAARAWLPTNPRVLMVNIFSCVVAAGIYQEANLPDKRAGVVRDALLYVHTLEPLLDDVPNSFWPIWYFYEEIGKREKALGIAKRSFERSRSPLAANMYSISLYHHHRVKEAVECLDRRRKTDWAGDITRAFMLVELLNGDWPALHEHEKNAHESLLSFRDVLLLLGKKNNAMVAARGQEFTNESKLVNSELSEENFLAKAGTAHTQKVEALYFIGLTRLAAGDRDGAREYFRKALGRRTCWSFCYMWSRMFLSRLDENSEWPPWIPRTKGQTNP